MRKVKKHMPMFFALIITVSMVFLMVFIGSYRSLTRAVRQAEAGFSVVENVVSKRIDALRNLNALAIKIIPEDDSVLALAEALLSAQNSSSKEEVLISYKILLVTEEEVLIALSRSDNVSEKDARLLDSIKKKIATAQQQFASAIETYNNGFREAIDIYSKSPIQGLFKNPEEGLIQ